MSLAKGCQDYIFFTKNFDISVISICSFGKYSFSETVFNVMLIYQPHSILLKEFCEILVYLFAANSIEVIAEDFNYD